MIFWGLTSPLGYQGVNVHQRHQESVRLVEPWFLTAIKLDYNAFFIWRTVEAEGFACLYMQIISAPSRARWLNLRSPRLTRAWKEFSFAGIWLCKSLKIIALQEYCLTRAWKELLYKLQEFSFTGILLCKSLKRIALQEFCVTGILLCMNFALQEYCFGRNEKSCFT